MKTTTTRKKQEEEERKWKIYEISKLFRERDERKQDKSNFKSVSSPSSLFQCLTYYY